jgi:hypothetical protein
MLAELDGQQFGNADQVVSDQIEREACGDGCDTSMFGFAHCAVLLAPAEDAFGHLSTGLRYLVADVAGCPRIDRAHAPLAGLGETVVLRNVWGDAHPA